MKLFLFLCSLLALVSSTTWPAPDETPYCENCANNQLYFIVDQSQSILFNTYQQELQFINDIVTASAGQKNTWQQYIDFNYDVAVGFTLFSTGINSNMDLLSFTSPQQVTAYVNSQMNNYPGGTSNLCGALQQAISDFQSYAGIFPSRAKQPKTLLIFTDGDPENDAGTCTQVQAIATASTLKTVYSAQIICIAVPGVNGLQNATNTPVLGQIASSANISGLSTPLVFNLNGPDALQNAKNQIVSRMGCCSCFPDLVITAEVDEYTDGGSFLPSVFTNINEIVNGFGFNSAENETYASLIVYSDHTETFTVIAPPGFSVETNGSDCANAACWKSVMCQYCPRGCDGKDTSACYWGGGSAILRDGLLGTVQQVTSEAHLKNITNVNRKNSPNVNVFISTGSCNTNTPEGHTGCNTALINKVLSETGKPGGYWSNYPYRVGVILQVDGNVTNVPMMNTIMGNPNNGYTVTAGAPNLGTTVATNIKRFLSDQPGCNGFYS